MKLKPKSPKKKIVTILIIVVAGLMVLGAAAYALYQANQTSQTSSDTTGFQDAHPMTPEEEKQQQSYEEQKKQDATESDGKQEPDDQVAVHFTVVNQHENTIQIRAEIAELLSDGTCILTLTKNGSTVTKTASTQTLAHISTCQGFDVPVSELSPGEWTISLDVTNNNRKGHAETTLTIS